MRPGPHPALAATVDDDPAVLHDDQEASGILQDAYVPVWLAVDEQKIGELARLERAEAIPGAERQGGVARAGEQGVRRRHAALHHELELARILAAGIQAVVQLAAEEATLELPRDLLYCRVPILDGPGNDFKLLSLAATTIANLLEKKLPTLVCCGGGMSRSPALAAAALAMVYQDDADKCLKQIAEHHPADVVPGLWSEVKGLVEGDRL